jgi:transcriptional regulator with XRE-family HTH domain
MKTFSTKGAVIKALREQLSSGSYQKEMSHAVGMSIRSLRSIENANKAVTLAQLERLAAYLNVSEEKIAYSVGGPKLVSSDTTCYEKLIHDWSKDQFVERMDEAIASVITDEVKLVQAASNTHDLRAHVTTTLNDETSVYVEELTELLRAQTWRSDHGWQNVDEDKSEVQRRVRTLLVLLRGNDIWTYQEVHFRRLPERDDLPPPDEPSQLEARLVIGFGPPGEYGETSIHVPIDHGQPFILKGRIDDLWANGSNRG